MAGYQDKVNTLPGSKSLHSGVAKVPMYFVIAGEILWWGALGRTTKAKSDLAILLNLSALQNDVIQSETQSEDCA